MYVCICKAVTEKQIRQAAVQGVDNLYGLRASLGVGSGCGRCADMAQDILREYQPRQSQPSLYVPSAA